MFFLPTAEIAASISELALSGDHSLVSYSLAMVTLPSRTLWAPALNWAAFGSVTEPLTMTIFDFLSALLPSACSRAWPWVSPTFSLSNEV